MMVQARLFNSSVFLTVLLLFIIGINGQTRGQSSEYLLKAGFMERFTRFIDWPTDSIQSDTTRPFIIMVLENNPICENLKSLFSKTRIKNRRVIVRSSSRLDTTGYYHMIFIGGPMSGELKMILRYTSNKPVITVSDTRGFGERGVLINFFIENNKIRFEINQDALRKTRLKMSHLLLNTAKLI